MSRRFWNKRNTNGIGTRRNVSRNCSAAPGNGSRYHAQSVSVCSAICGGLRTWIRRGANAYSIACSDSDRCQRRNKRACDRHFNATSVFRPNAAKNFGRNGGRAHPHSAANYGGKSTGELGSATMLHRTRGNATKDSIGVREQHNHAKRPASASAMSLHNRAPGNGRRENGNPAVT